MSELIKEKISLKELNTWKVGGEAEYFCQPKNLEQLKDVLVWAEENSQKVTALSGGSNVLISDEGIKGLVVCTRSLNIVQEDNSDSENLRVVAEAGASKSEALKLFLKHKLPPALFLTGLPGDIGGGVVMNAGVGEKLVPREFCEITEWVEVVRVEQGQAVVKRFSTGEIDWVYRHSSGWQPGVIYRVGLFWPMQPDPEIMQKIKAATRKRIKTQPINFPTCGSTFRNPQDSEFGAGALIEKSGLKGFKIGGAEVSQKHANFIVTYAGASAKDVDQLIQHMQKTVKEKFSVDLETEVKYLGQW